MISVYPITGDVCFDRLIKVASASFLHFTVTLFPYVMNKYICYFSSNFQFLHSLVYIRMDS